MKVNFCHTQFRSKHPGSYVEERHALLFVLVSVRVSLFPCPVIGLLPDCVHLFHVSPWLFCILCISWCVNVLSQSLIVHFGLLSPSFGFLFYFHWLSALRTTFLVVMFVYVAMCILFWSLPMSSCTQCPVPAIPTLLLFCYHVHGHDYVSGF